VRKLTGIAAVLLFGAFALTGCGGKQEDTGSAPATPANAPAPAGGGGGDQQVVIAWAQWPPATALQELAADFTAETKIPVKVEQIPWPQFQDKITTGVWAGKSDAYDLIIGDSQWLGQGATEGHYVELTDWAKDHVKMDEISPQALAAYGEYPAGSKKYYALPCESDGLGFAYRKDLFENPQEKAAFKAKYHYDLAPPKDWKAFRDIAEFFTRPDKNLYGAALFYSKDYDGITMGFEQILWDYGADFHDASGKVEGVINTPAAADALKFYAQDLKKFCPPGAESFYFNETTEKFGAGQVAMAEQWYAFMPGFTDPTGKNKNYLEKTGFFVAPAGPTGHFISLGGQGISLSAYSKRQDAAKKFLEWFEKKETQQKWAQKGGLTADLEVMKSPQFLSYAPYNQAFSESFPHLKDFYNIPAYAKLLESCQIHWNNVVSNQEQPKPALDAIAKEHTDILKQAGVLK
jgi:multiple sugar transport system substrate-binding protein